MHDQCGGRGPFWVATVATLFACGLLAPRLASGALEHWDEAWYAQVSHEMVETGDWLTLHWNFAPWYHKPPLAFWATSLLYLLAGESETTARLFSFFCTLGCVAAAAHFAARRLGAAGGFFCAFALLSVPDFGRFGARGQLEGPLSLWTTLALLAFWQGLVAPKRHWLMGLFLGLAFLTKGAAGGLILVVQAAYMLSASDFSPLRQRPWWGGLGLAAALAGPWHCHQIFTHGGEFVSAYFSRHIQQFFVHIYPEVQYRPAGPTYYVEHLIDNQQPVGWLILGLAVLGGWFAFRTKDRESIFFWSWTTIPLLALSLAHTKWYWYLVPLYPGAAIFASLLASRLPSLNRLAIGAAAAALVTAASIHWTGGDHGYANDIKAMSSLVRRFVPPKVPIHTLQVARASQSVYPISTLYYCQRPVQVAHGAEHFVAICRNSDAMFYALVHDSLVGEIEQSGMQTIDGRWFRIEIAGDSGPVVLLRVVPGYLAEAIYGRKPDSSVVR